MRKSMLVCGLLAAGCFIAASVKAEDKKEAPKAEAAAADAKEAPKADAAKPAADKAADKKETPEFLTFDKAKLGAVKFPHKMHAEKNGGCAACHEGKEPLFKMKKAGGFKMADMYAGKSCGICHTGKEKDGKVVFAAKGACTKCHKKG